MHVQPTTRVGLEHHLDLHDLRAARIGILARAGSASACRTGFCPGRRTSSMFNKVVCSVLVSVLVSVFLSVLVWVVLWVLLSAAGSGPSGTAADTSIGATGAGQHPGRQLPEIATRLAVVGQSAPPPRRSTGPPRPRRISGNTTTADESGRIPSPMRRNCVPLSGCSR